MSNQVSCVMNADDSWLDPEDSNNQTFVRRGIIAFILVALILALSGAPYSNPIVFLILVVAVFCSDLAVWICIRELCISLRGKRSSIC